MSEINAAIQAEKMRVEKLVVRALVYLGEQCIKKVRDRNGEDSWFDQSGNLRSSIGYVIAHNGNIIQYSDFSQVRHGSEGAIVGKKLAEELIETYSNDYVLIVVAGMNYAELVESLDNKDVLASTELWATKELPNMMNKLKNQIAK